MNECNFCVLGVSDCMDELLWLGEHHQQMCKVAGRYQYVSLFKDMLWGSEKTPSEGHIKLIFLLVLSIWINPISFLYEHSKYLNISKEMNSW